MKTFCVFVALAIFVAADAASQCTSETLCTCTTATGVIDLTPLTKPLQVSDSAGKFTYFYSPCSNNTVACPTAMVCKKSLTGSVAIGKTSGESFIDQNGEVAIEYHGDKNMTSIVVLECDQTKDGELTIMDDTDSTSYEFKLASKYACIGGPKATTTKKPATTTKKAATTTKKAATTTKKAATTTKKAATTTKKAPTTTKKAPTTTKKAATTTKKAATTTKKGKTTKKGTTKKHMTTTKKGTTSKKPPTSTKKASSTTKKHVSTTKKHVSTTKKMPTTTHGGAASHCSISMAALSVLVLMFRQLF